MRTMLNHAVAEYCWYIYLSGKTVASLQLRAVRSRPYTWE